MPSLIKFAIGISIAFCASCSLLNKTLRDTSRHAVRFVAVEKNVQLEVLDWGGSGKSIVLLAGGGNTAHVFDDFAQTLKKHFRVYGITRRGFGRSQFSPIENNDRLAKDILGVLDSMKILKPVLVGHSIAGAELSAIARISPNRISALIYLEAGYPYAFNNGKSPTMKDFLNLGGPQQPSPEEKDLASFKALQNWYTKTYGFQVPQEEFLQTWDSTPDGRPTHRRNFPGFTIFPMLMNDSEKHDTIPISSLVIYAIPHIMEAWMIESTNENIRSEAESYFLKIDSLAMKQANAFQNDVPLAQVVILPGMHYVYISNKPEVIYTIRQFVRRLK